MSTLWMVLDTYLAGVRDEEGQGLAEYALIIVLVSIAVVTALGLVGTQIDTVFNDIVSSLTVS